ncbi:MAG: hypothetical protein MjAS7_0878 [Metallosphaera javensis (ex Sakai et al. 2022)]|nr:MAG: hypothetical protein MjAS7_0878 [Metallosphaera javensis (ex Sakai et al. 2022)]
MGDQVIKRKGKTALVLFTLLYPFDLKVTYYRPGNLISFTLRANLYTVKSKVRLKGEANE